MKQLLLWRSYAYVNVTALSARRRGLAIDGGAVGVAAAAGRDYGNAAGPVVPVAAAAHPLASGAGVTPDTPPQASNWRLLMHFYTDPQPVRLVGFLERYEKIAQGRQPFPPVAGFLAIVFRQHPDWIEKLMPDQPDSRTAVAIAAALRLSGEPAIQPSLQSRLANAGADPSLRAELANLPLRLEELHVVTPTHLDVLWGASFASGDERYPRMVADFLAETANRSEPIAIDVAKLCWRRSEARARSCVN